MLEAILGASGWLLLWNLLGSVFVQVTASPGWHKGWSLC